MSHVSGGSSILKDLEALVAACLEVHGLTFKHNQKTHRWYGKWVNDYSQDDAAYKHGIKPEDYGKCEHAIEVAGSGYDIGVVKRPDGKGYTLVWDFYGTGQKINSTIGANAEKLLTVYNKHAALNAAKRKGLIATKQSLSGGGYVITINT